MDTSQLFGLASPLMMALLVTLLTADEVKGAAGDADGGPQTAVAAAVRPGGCVNEATGAMVSNGEEWRVDPCTTCRCDEGRKKCHAYMCRASCLKPRHVPGECCPVCDGTSVVTLPPHCPSLTQCSLRCLQGLVRDKDGCFLCQCQSEECKLDCPHGFARDTRGNKLCQCMEPSAASSCPLQAPCKKNCTHGLRLNRQGCPICKCNKCRQMLFSSLAPALDGGSMGALIESSTHGVLLLCPGPCLHGHMKDEQGCPTCWCNDTPQSSEDITAVYSEEATKATSSCILTDGTRKGPDDVWWSSCLKCRCVEGVESCSSSASGPPAAQPCEHPIIINGHCCPVCSESISLIAVSMCCALVLVMVTLVVLRIRHHFVWWPQRPCPCMRETDEDGGGVRVLRAIPSSLADTPEPTPQGDTIKYDISALPLSGKGVRHSGEYYKSVPHYDPAIGDSEKSVLAAH